jgi:hypothetical protein
MAFPTPERSAADEYQGLVGTARTASPAPITLLPGNKIGRPQTERPGTSCAPRNSFLPSVASCRSLNPTATESARERFPDRRRIESTLAEPVIVAQWWKNRAGETVRVQLSAFESQNLIDIRTWRADRDGITRPVPGKGIACTLKHATRLASALMPAARKAEELGLLPPPSAEDAQ